ncbi:MAG: hypothetical protein L3J39_15415 [Verrucomicrobiales bacterium]|nr:hypothetical protein [Verrucomicrobiales bacterium]
MAAKNELEQLKAASKVLSVAKVEELNFEGFVINKDQRVCVNVMVVDDGGEIIRQIREFIDVPQTMRIYTDWSYYTKEKDAKIIVQFDGDFKSLKTSKIKIEVFTAGYMKSPRIKKAFLLKGVEKQQIFNLPIKPLRHEKIYTVRATLLDQGDEALMQAETLLTTRPPATVTEVKVNRINRGVYVNGEPFLPYGILVANLNEEQLKYYKECGFSSIQFIGHWNKLETNLKFLENCQKLGIKAQSFHVARPYTSDAAEAVKHYSAFSSFVGLVPNDETPNRIAYQRAARVKAASPMTLNLTNHNVNSYLAFSNRIDGFPGDVQTRVHLVAVIRTVFKRAYAATVDLADLCSLGQS